MVTRGGRTSTAPLTAVDLLHGLVSIPSLSGEEAAAVAWLGDAMDALCYRVRIDDAGNAVGTIGEGEREILLLGHIDTVPGDIPVRITNGVLHGRGAVDAKGPLAAFVVAGARAQLPDDVRLTVVGAVGEETYGSPGATWLAESHPAPYAVIIGEPSGWDGLVLGYKGSLGLTVTTTCDVSHSAGPGATASELAIRVWLALRSWLAEYNQDAPPGFETLDATLRSMWSGSDGLIDRAILEISLRLPPGVPGDWVRKRVEDIVHGPTTDLAWQLNAEGYRTNNRSPLVPPFLAAIRAHGGIPRLKVKTGTSDMNIVGPTWNCPIVSYGPGDARFDHTPDEQIDLNEYERGIDVLVTAIERIVSDGTRDAGRGTS